MDKDRPPGFADTPATVLNGIASRVAARLQRLGIETVQDLLFHLPARYEDRTQLRPLGSLQAGSEVMIQGTVELSEVRFGRRRMLLTRVSDGTGFMTLRFFHFSAAQQREPRPGDQSSAVMVKYGAVDQTSK